MFYAFQELMHQVVLVPLVVLLVSLRAGHGVRAWLLAGALSVSWIMDSVNIAFLSNGLFVLIAQYGKPITIALALGAVVEEPKVLARLSLGLMALVAASAIQGMNTVEIVVPVLGGLAITLFAWKSQAGLYRVGTSVYFGAGAIAWVAWSLAASEPTRMAFVTWFAYQGTRLAGILLITAAMVQKARQPRLELV